MFFDIFSYILRSLTFWFSDIFLLSQPRFNLRPTQGFWSISNFATVNIFFFTFILLDFETISQFALILTFVPLLLCSFLNSFHCIQVIIKLIFATHHISVAQVLKISTSSAWAALWPASQILLDIQCLLLISATTSRPIPRLVLPIWETWSGTRNLKVYNMSFLLLRYKMGKVGYCGCAWKGLQSATTARVAHC